MRRHFFGGDKVLWTIVAMLVVISLLVIYSASYYRTGGDKMGLRDVVIIGIGLVAMIAVYLMPYRWYSIFAHPVFWIALGVTLLTSGRNNSWIPGFNFAPFEVLKVGLVMVLARELGSNMRQRILPLARTWNENKKILMTRTIWIFLPIILTILVTWKIGTSTTILVGITAALMFYMGLVKWSDIFALVGAGLVAVLIAMAFGLGRGDTAGSRFEQWRPDMFSEHTIIDTDIVEGDTLTQKLYYNRGEHEQNVAAKMAIASGRIVGKGPGMSTMRAELSEAQSDFAYAFIIEEYGLVGGLLVLFLFICFFYRVVLIFRLCKSAQPALLVLGLGVMITLQALMHMAVSVSLIPNTGQQLPLISKGGSSVIFTLVAIGMILGISRQMKRIES